MKFAHVSNLLARSFIVFMLAYLWLSFYMSNLLIVFAISLVVTVVLNSIYYLLANRRNKQTRLTREEQDHMRKITLQLKFLSKTKTLLLFKAALEKLYPEQIKVTSKKISIHGNDKHIDFFPLFTIEITVANIIACINATKSNATTYIAAETFSPLITSFTATLEKEVILLDAMVTYKQILLPSEVFPEIAVEFKTKKRLTIQALRNIAFARNKVRPYIVMGLLVLFTSFIVQLSIYYIVVATILFLFALVSLFVPYSKRGYF